MSHHPNRNFLIDCDAVRHRTTTTQTTAVCCEWRWCVGERARYVCVSVCQRQCCVCVCLCGNQLAITVPLLPHSATATSIPLRPRLYRRILCVVFSSTAVVVAVDVVVVAVAVRFTCAIFNWFQSKICTTKVVHVLTSPHVTWGVESRFGYEIFAPHHSRSGLQVVSFSMTFSSSLLSS